MERAQLAYRQFDRQTNPVAEEVIQEHPELFENWVLADFDELHSRFGAGKSDDPRKACSKPSKP